MNKNNIRRRLSAQMQFKSLLLLTLLAGNAPAQQTLMPPLTLGIPGIPTLNASVVDGKCGASRSTWTLRQHATWLLGLKPRQVMQSEIASALPEVPQLELQPTMAALPELPDMSRDAVMLVQHTEPVASPDEPALLAQVAATAVPAVVTAAGQSAGDAAPVAHALQSSPHSLDLRPVVSGPAPALPLEAMAAESLLQVDVSGVDPSKLGALPSQSESLIDSFGFRPPTGFSMSDSEPASLAANASRAKPAGFSMSDSGPASLAASPSRAKPVSIHEGFAPRNSAANQGAQLTTVSGPVHNRLSDSESVDAGDSANSDNSNQKSLAKKTATRPVEINLSDKNSPLASLPVEVSSEGDRSSRSGRPEVLTPPSRLAKDAPKALPLSDAMPIASTGVENAIPIRQPRSEGGKLAESKLKPAADQPVAMATPASDKQTDKPGSNAPAKSFESLIDGLVPPPTLLAEKVIAPMPTTDKPVTDTPVTDTPAKDKPVMDKPAPSPRAVVAKAEPPRSTESRSAEKLTFTDANPIALKRPVVKAANVAIPETARSESAVVPSSHEMDEGSQQLAEYAKLAASMQQAIKQKFPSCRVKITCNEDGLIADGHVANNTEASKVLSYVRKTSLCPVADRITTSQ